MPYLGEITGLLTSICWTFTAMFFAEAARRLGPFQVNMIRIPMALILLLFSYLIIYHDFRIASSALIFLVLSGVIGLVLGDTFLFEALVHIGPRLTLLVFSLSPGMTALLAYFFLGERISLIGSVGIGVTIVGILFVVLERQKPGLTVRHKMSLIGFVFAVLGGVGQAVGLVLAKAAFKYTVNPLFATLIRMGAAALFIWPAAAAIGRLQNPLRLVLRNRDALPFLLAGTFFGPFLGIWLSLISVKNTDTGVAATLMSLMPILIIPVEVVLHGEKISLRAILGTLMAVAGVAILFLR